MLNILNNPGLQHLVENIFFNLDVEHLQICGHLNQSSKLIFDGPMFQDPMYWLKQFKGLSIEKQNDWANVMQTLHDSFRRKYAMISYLRWNLKKAGNMVDHLCFTNIDVEIVFSKKIKDIFEKRESSDEDMENLKILVPLTRNIQTADDFRLKILKICMNKELCSKDSEIVKILVPFMKNTYALDKYGKTLIYWAALNGHTEIVKILVPLTDNPNAPNKHGKTPSSVTKNVEIKRLLETFK